MKTDASKHLTAIERATKFVENYPLMFKEDQEFWIEAIGKMILEAEIAQVKSDQAMALRILSGATA
jgi:hypothetical protein